MIGEEGQGFKYILGSMNAERTLIGAECLGDAQWFLAKATAYANERKVFGRPIGQNQGVQFPIARAHMATEAAALMVERRSEERRVGKEWRLRRAPQGSTGIGARRAEVAGVWSPL